VAKKPRKKAQKIPPIERIIEADRPMTRKGLEIIGRVAPSWADHCLARTIILLATAVEQQVDLAFINAITPGERPVTIAIGIGEDASDFLQHSIKGAFTEQEEQNDDDHEA
jgi:hypothetical protein